MQCSVEVFGLFLYFPSCVHVLGDSRVASEEVDSLVAAIRVNLKGVHQNTADLYRCYCITSRHDIQGVLRSIRLLVLLFEVSRIFSPVLSALVLLWR